MASQLCARCGQRETTTGFLVLLEGVPTLQNLCWQCAHPASSSVESLQDYVKWVAEALDSRQLIDTLGPLDVGAEDLPAIKERLLRLGNAVAFGRVDDVRETILSLRTAAGSTHEALILRVFATLASELNYEEVRQVLTSAAQGCFRETEKLGEVRRAKTFSRNEASSYQEIVHSCRKRFWGG